MKVGFVSCSHAKRDEPCPAKDLYVGTLFRYARQYMEHCGYPWFILSAKHGLLHPETIVAPYRQTIRNGRKADVERWSRMANLQVRARFPSPIACVAIIGLEYRGALEGYSVEYPVFHLKDIGRQQSELKRLTGPLKTQQQRTTV